MFQIWRYRTSWEDFHSSTSWLKIFFDIFWESNGIWSNKIWTESWLASEGLPGPILEFLTWLWPCPCAWCHYCKCMTTWQLRGHFLDLDSGLLTGSAPAPIQDIPTPCMRCSRLSGPCQFRGWGGATFTIYSDLKTGEWWVARSQSAASLHPFHYRPHNTLAPSSGLNYPFWPELIVILPWEAHASKWITDTLLRTDIGVGWGWC